MTNKQRIEEKVAELGLQIGCYCDGEIIENIPEGMMERVLDAIEYGTTTDVPVWIGGSRYIVEIISEGIEPEIDFSCLSTKDYLAKYGAGNKDALDFESA